ncbi:sugar porter (SP) family MFS transporter [Candida albicans L26]|nr:sugar porter (SP) family MFS transporter [Candida albicans L26]
MSYERIETIDNPFNDGNIVDNDTSTLFVTENNDDDDDNTITTTTTTMQKNNDDNQSSGFQESSNQDVTTVSSSSPSNSNNNITNNNNNNNNRFSNQRNNNKDNFQKPTTNHNEFKDSNTDEEEEEDDDDMFEPIQFKNSDDDDDEEEGDGLSSSSLSSDINSFTDNFGNSYHNIDFDNKRYTLKLNFKGKRLVYFTSGFVSLFVSLFGYSQGVVSSLLAFDTFNKYFNQPSAATIGIVISIQEIGAMISSIMVAKLSDKFGRKRTLLLGTFIFMIGGSLQAFCPNIFILAIGRVFSGMGVGILSTIVPSYQCEISPSEERGKLVCGEFTGNITGYALSVWVGYFSYFIQDIGDSRNQPHSFTANLSWRLPLFIQVVIAFVLFLGGFFIVESPRWLLDNDMDQQGFHVLALLYDSHVESTKPKSEFFMIKNSILQERITTPKSQRTWKHLLTHYKIRVFVACSSLIFAQFNGINIISYYAPLVFEQAGFDNANALLMTGINGIIYLLSTIPTWFLVDSWGRRPILITSGIAMAICLFLVAAFMHINKSYTPSVVAVFVIIYNASFGFGFGPIPFLLSSESYPLSVRSKGASLAVSCNWFSNFVVGLMTPILKQEIKWAMYLFPASSCVLSVIVVLLFYPETKGVELEDITRIFDEFYATSPTKRVKIRGLRTKRKDKGKRSGEKYKAKYNPLSGGGGTGTGTSSSTTTTGDFIDDQEAFEMRALNEFDFESDNDDDINVSHTRRQML